MSTADDFLARVERIQKNRATVGSTIFVGMDEAYVMPRRDEVHQKAAKKGGGKLLALVVLSAILVGGLVAAATLV